MAKKKKITKSPKIAFFKYCKNRKKLIRYHQNLLNCHIKLKIAILSTITKSHKKSPNLKKSLSLKSAKRITDHQKIGGFPSIYYIAKKSLKCQKSPFPKISKLSGVKIFNFTIKNQRT